MKNILLYFSVSVIVFISYFFMEKQNYVASWRVHIFAVLAPLLILTNAKKLNIYASLFIYTILLWHIIDVSADYFQQKE
uniref:Uncharacterized protein n=1 Tax=viral metagenome TaxID=1070528 RepID=A0A6C0D5Q5_9ZZZZ